MRFALDTVAPLGRGDVDLAVAHDLLDDVRPQCVVLAHHDAALGREHAPAEDFLVLKQGFLVLHVQGADVTDRAHAEAHQVPACMGRVTLEAAMQRAVLLREGEAVIRQGEMVHADVDVAGRAEFAHRELQKREARRRIRQILDLDLPLCLEGMRHVGVAVDREAVRPHSDHLVQRRRERGQVLPRQTVDQVEIDGVKAQFPCLAEDVRHHRHRLDAVDRLLHVRVEVLHSQAHAVEAELRQGAHVGGVDGARVDLDGVIARFGLAEPELPIQALQHRPQARLGQEGRRAPAEMQLFDLSVAVEIGAAQLDLREQPAHVGVGAVDLAGHDLVAAAVEAGAVAERDVHVDRQRTHRPGPGAAEGGGLVGVRCQILGELQGGGIRGVPRTFPVVAAHQVGVEADGRVHRSILVQPGRGSYMGFLLGDTGGST